MMKRGWWIAGSAVMGAVVLTGCGATPKSRAEFKDFNNDRQVAFTVPRNLDTVVATVNRQASTCVNGVRTQNRMSGSMLSTSREASEIVVTKVSATKAELDYRVRSNNTLFEPEGGQWMLVADYEARGPKSTAVTIYHYPMSDTKANAVRKWSEGDVSACHGFGGK